MSPFRILRLGLPSSAIKVHRRSPLFAVTRQRLGTGHRSLHSSPRHCSQNQEGDVIFRKVKVQKKIFTFRRLGLLALYILVPYYICGVILGHVLEGVDADEVEERVSQEQDGDDSNTDVNDADSIFIPVLYPKEEPPRPFQRSDPELREFLQLARDKNKQQDLKDRLTQTIAQGLNKDNSMRSKIGSDIACAREWVDIDIPRTHPPTYARKGLHFTGDSIYWASQSIPWSQYQRIHRILYPTVFGNALVHAGGLYYLIKVTRIKKYFGMDLDRREQALLHMRHQIKHIQDAVKAQVGSERAPNSSSGPETARLSIKNPQSSPSPVFPQSPLSPARPLPPMATPTSGDASLGKGTGTPLELSLLDTLGLMAPLDTGIAIRAFQARFKERWALSGMHMNKAGYIYISGQLLFSGTKGAVKLEVASAYDFKTKQFAYLMVHPARFEPLPRRPPSGT